ncbi:glycosyltransferase family 4 protein [Acidimicrobiia bacterium EGI L10123]|uniref:glycosyltransferase family 4 protein n=1 Tax=Salinilacustrithrix flava TaxID=2957203 RepID=UPI003D7C1C75|nr:glycosyltransferase family 4 protein [Acidimicrobiia bacterium EGI L10123]
MRIGVDATSVLDERSGVEGHVFAAVEALAQAPDDEVVAFVRRQVPTRWRHGPDRLRTVCLSTDSQAAATQLHLPRAIRQVGVDVLYCPAKPPPARPGVPVLDAIHDIVPWSRPETMGRGAGAWYRTFDRVAVQRGAHISTGTRAVAEELGTVLPVSDRVHVVGGAMPPWLEAAARAGHHERPAVAGDGPYVLSICRIEPRKDLGTLLDAWELLGSARGATRLLLVGKVGWKVDAVVDRARRTAGVELCGWVDEADLPGLYAHAEAFVSPSLEEGFGLPVLEAMAFGAPVVASAIPPHLEVGQGGIDSFSPGDPAELAEHLLGLLGDERRRRRLTGAGRRRAACFSGAALGRRLRRALEAAA